LPLNECIGLKSPTEACVFSDRLWVFLIRSVHPKSDSASLQSNKYYIHTSRLDLYKLLKVVRLTHFYSRAG